MSDKSQDSPSAAPSVEERLFLAIAAPDARQAISELSEALRAGASPNAISNERMSRDQSALDAACRLDAPWAAQLVLELLDAGATPLFEDERTALQTACRFGHMATIKALMARGHSPRVANVNGWTPFLCGAVRGRFDICQLLAPSSNLDARAQNGEGDEPRDAASWLATSPNPRQALEAYQLGWGSPNGAAGHPQTPLMRAIRDKRDGLVDYLAARAERDPTRGPAAMHAAVAAKREDYARLLIKHGYPFNEVGATGCSPLAHALAEGAWGCAKALLEAGADPALRDPRAVDEDSEERKPSYLGLDALCAAAANADPEAFAFARGFAAACDRGASEEDSGYTALHYAARHTDPVLAKNWVEMLLELGWNPNIQDKKHGQTPLMTAISRESLGAIEALLPVTDLALANHAELDALAGAQWLATEKNKPGPRDLILAFQDQAALNESLPPSSIKSSARSL